MAEKAKLNIWNILLWPLAVSTLAWLLVSGVWALSLAQEAADLWIGQPRSVPFIPYLDTDTLVVPLAPFHALLARGDWMPLVALSVGGLGTGALWKATESVAKRARAAKEKAV